VVFLRTDHGVIVSVTQLLPGIDQLCLMLMILDITKCAIVSKAPMHHSVMALIGFYYKFININFNLYKIKKCNTILS
jgi:hypothetical protein